MAAIFYNLSTFSEGLNLNRTGHEEGQSIVVKIIIQEIQGFNLIWACELLDLTIFLTPTILKSLRFTTLLFYHTKPGSSQRQVGCPSCPSSGSKRKSGAWQVEIPCVLNTRSGGGWGGGGGGSGDIQVTMGQGQGFAPQ